MSTKTVVVRYRLKPECVAEHEKLLAAVFAQLEAERTAGVEYRAIKLEDGVSFVHVADVAGAKNPLVELSAFKAFTRDVGARCDDPPVSTAAKSFGRHVVRSTA